MKLITARQFLSLILTALVALTVVTGCGGSGGSATGGGGQLGTSSISGNVNGGLTFHQDEAVGNGLLASVSNWVIPAAIAAGVAGVEVELLLNGAVVQCHRESH